MSHTRIIKGKLTEMVKGEYNMFAKDNITFNSAKQVTDTGLAKGVSYGSPKLPPAPEITAKCMVHFRAKKGWQGEEYGFDWMRLGETSNFGDTKYEDIVAKQYTDNTYKTLEKDINKYEGSFKKSPTLFSNLRKMYGVYDIPWRKKSDGTLENYFCSWLSLYPSKIKDLKTGKLVASGFNNTKAVLSLIVDVEEEPDSLKFKENKYFTITPLEITPKTKGKHNLADFVTIECIEEFATDQVIEVYATKKDRDGKDQTELAGKLKVWANNGAKRKKAKVLLIELKTKKTVVGSSLGQKQLFENYLRQALIETEVETRTIDLSSDVNFQTGGRYVKGGQVAAYYDPPTSAPTGFIPLENYINSKLKAELKKNKEPETRYNNHYKAIYLGENGGYVDVSGILNRLNGYSSGKFVVLFPSKNNQTAAHEFLHSFKLPHSFTNSEADANAEFTYEYAKTENLMDYSHRISKTRFNLWKWQWAKVNANIK